MYRPSENKSRDNQRAQARAGLSLLEVILALAILGLTIAATGELVRIGSRSAAAARDLTTAQLLCESKMAEITAGILLLEPTGPMPIEWETDWFYSVMVEPTQLPGLLAVSVTVEQSMEASNRPAFFTLVRWITDPQILWPDPAAAAQESTGGTSPSDGSIGGGSNG